MKTFLNPNSAEDSPKETHGQENHEHKQEQQPCHLLLLPAELRLQIYEAIIAPVGALHLTATASKRHAIVPDTFDPAFLRTNRQIHHEARKLLLSANELTIPINAQDTCWPTIPERRLPQRVLEKLEHLCVILYCTAGFYRASFKDVDFTAFEALISLKTLRVAVNVERPLPFEALVQLLKEILIRIPKDVRLLCRFEEGSLQDQVRRGTGEIEQMSSVEEAVLESAIEEIPAEIRGRKSGGNVDVFAEYRGS